MMEPWWRTLLREQQRAGFADIAGASASVVLPISDRLLTQLAAERMPPNWVSEITVHAEPGEQFSVRVRLAKLSFLPSIRVRLRIHRQPAFPAAPVLVLRLVTEG